MPVPLAPTEIKQQIDQRLAKLRALHDDPASPISDVTRAKLKTVLYDRNVLGIPKEPVRVKNVFPLSSAAAEAATAPLPSIIEHPFKRALASAGRSLAGQAVGPAAVLDTLALPIRAIGRPAVETVTGRDPQLNIIEKAARSLQQDRDIGNVGMTRETADAPTIANRLIAQGVPMDQAYKMAQDRVTGAWLLGGAVENAMGLVNPVAAIKGLGGVGRNLIQKAVKPAAVVEDIEASLAKTVPQNVAIPEQAPIDFEQWMGRPEAPISAPDATGQHVMFPPKSEGKMGPQIFGPAGTTRIKPVPPSGWEQMEMPFPKTTKEPVMITDQSVPRVPRQPVPDQQQFPFMQEQPIALGKQPAPEVSIQGAAPAAQGPAFDFTKQASWAQDAGKPVSLQDLINGYVAKGVKPGAARRMAEADMGIAPETSAARPTSAVAGTGAPQKPIYTSWQDDTQELVNLISENMPTREHATLLRHVYDGDNAIAKGDLQGAVESLKKLRGKVDDETFDVLDAAIRKYEGRSEPVVVPPEELALEAEFQALRPKVERMKKGAERYVQDIEGAKAPVSEPTALDLKQALVDLKDVLEGGGVGLSTKTPEQLAKGEAALLRWREQHGPAILAAAKKAGKDAGVYLREQFPDIPEENLQRMAEALRAAPTPAVAKNVPQDNIPITTKTAKGKDLGQYKGKVNLSVYKEPEVAGKVMDVVDAKKRIAEGMHISDAEVSKMAAAIAEGERTKHLIKAMIKQPGQLAAEVKAVGAEAASKIQAFLKSDLGADAVRIKDLVDDMIADSVSQRTKALSEVGRALRVGGLPVEAQQTLAKQFEDVLIKYKGDKNITAAIKKLREIVLDPEFNPSAWDKLYYIWINGLVGGPKTLAVNLLGNTTHLISKAPDRVLESLVDMAFSLKTGTRSTTMDEVLRMLTPSKDVMPTKFQHNVSKAMDEIRYQSPLIDKATSKLEPAMYGTKVLGKTDQFYGNLAARMEWKALRGKGLSDLELQNLISSESKLRTFTRDPSALTKVLLFAKEKLKGARWVLPFVRTMSDIIGQAVEHTPAGAINLVRKSTSQRDAVQRTARILKGTLLGVWAYDQMKKGRLTGDAPKTPKERAHFLQVQKKQENAVLINGKWVPLSNFEPVGSIVSAFVNYFEGAEKAKKDDKAIGEQIAAGIAKASVALGNKRALSGVMNLINAVSDPEKRFPQLLGQIIAGFIPGAVTAITNQTDTTVRKAADIGQQIKKRTPGLSKQVTPALDVYGRAQKKPSTLNVLNAMPATLAPEDRLTYDTPMNAPSERINGAKLTPAEYAELSRDAGQLKKRFILQNADKLRRLKGDRKQYFVDRLSQTVNEAAKVRFIQKYPKYRPQFPFLD